MGRQGIAANGNWGRPGRLAAGGRPHQCLPGLIPQPSEAPTPIRSLELEEAPSNAATPSSPSQSPVRNPSPHPSQTPDPVMVIGSLGVAANYPEINEGEHRAPGMYRITFTHTTPCRNSRTTTPKTRERKKRTPSLTRLTFPPRATYRRSREDRTRLIHQAQNPWSCKPENPTTFPKESFARKIRLYGFNWVASAKSYST